MKYRDILKLKSDVTTKVEGSSVVDSNETNTKIYEAFRRLIMEIRPRSLRRVKTLRNMYSDISSIYKLPDDVNRIEYVRIASEDDKYHINDINFTDVRSKTIGRNRLTLEYATDFINGEQVIVIDADHVKTQSVTLSDYSNLSNIQTTNTTVPVAELDIYNNLKAIKFDLDTEQHTATIRDIYPTPTDVTSTIKGDLSINLKINFDNVDVIDSITLKLNDGTNTVELTNSEVVESNRFEAGKNIINFRINKNLSFDIDNLVYSEVVINYNSVNREITDEVKNITIESISVTNGHDIVISYISDAPFYNQETHTHNKEPISDNDIIELDDDAYVILLTEFAGVLSNELQGEDGVYNKSLITKELEGDGRDIGFYKKYKAKYRDQTQRISEQYYTPSTNPNRFDNRNIV